jgi:hypothetical protein
MPEKWSGKTHNFEVTTTLAIALVLSAWLVLPFPLAVLVGRSLRAGASARPAVVAPADVAGLDLSPV